MAQNTVKARFIIQHKTASAFASDKTVYYEGELLIEEDTLKMKVGDGTNTFANLDYINLNPTEVQSLINAAKHTHSNKSVLDATTASFTTALLNKLNGIAANANNYVHPSTAGNKHIPSGGSSGQILRWSSDGTAVWGTDNNTTYSNMSGASSSAAGKAGLVPAPSAGASNRYLRSDGTWQVPPDTNTTYSTGNATTAGITKLYTATGSGTDGTMTQKAITDVLNGKANLSHTHNYAGASNPGGAAYTAERLTTGTAGSSTTPVYFSNGSPVACNKSFDELKNEFILACYPVGSIYMSTSSTNPGSLFGGTWVAWGSGRVPVGVNTNDTNFNTVEKTGGESTVTLSVYNMPSHYHTVNSHNHSIPRLSGTAASNGAHTHNVTFKYNSDAQQNGRAARITSGGSRTTALNSDVSDIKSAGAHTHSISTNAGTTGNTSPNTNSRGSGSAHNNLQPYITCYMWKRTA